MALLTIPVLLYQCLFVLIQFVASRIGRKTGLVMLVLSLAWTLTHLFFWPLMVLQSVVIVTSWRVFRKRRGHAEKYPAKRNG
ncbi:hypothetical protein EBB59_10130 [Lysobacter pythonis]|uniref:Uncharacterized protein n=1 Tax=Solilutibacter pythonis TaxID=2483112 RepID=A0A3M2HM48_9GAMM|nr:hypothetical protein [Lysobacter pythonis]RMH90791.1 hypothetical protein EBB59_10130 [Lysobacter pythonis]